MKTSFRSNELFVFKTRLISKLENLVIHLFARGLSNFILGSDKTLLLTSDMRISTSTLGQSVFFLRAFLTVGWASRSIRPRPPVDSRLARASKVATLLRSIPKMPRNSFQNDCDSAFSSLVPSHRFTNCWALARISFHDGGLLTV